MLKKILVCLLLALALPLAACSNAGNGEIQVSDEEYPKDIFFHLPEIDSYGIRQLDRHGNVKNYSVEARSKYKSDPIIAYYDTLLQNANTIHKSTEDDACTMQGSFYGYQFTINIRPDTVDKKYRSVLTIHLSQLESNMIVNGTPYYLDPSPVWMNGELWLPGRRSFR
jgi:cold shock CspA family protein